MKAPHHAQHHRATSHAVGKTPKPAGGATGGGGGGPVGGKGTATHKHHAASHRKHQPKKARKWTPDGDVALCSARAVAESLRLALGVRVADEHVLALYARTQRDPDAGETLSATLEAASGFGLGGLRPLSFEEVMPHGHSGCCCCRRPSDLLRETRAGLILGIDLPGLDTHAVLDDGRAWWSWGRPYNPADFPGAVVEEAWAVTW